jgi:hypothetical protein
LTAKGWPVEPDLISSGCFIYLLLDYPADSKNKSFFPACLSKGVARHGRPKFLKCLYSRGTLHTQGSWYEPSLEKIHHLSWIISFPLEEEYPQFFSCNGSL